MCDTIKFEQSVGGFLWNPTTAVLTDYTPIIDTPVFTTEADAGNFYRGIYTGDGQIVRRVLLNLTMDETDMKTLIQFRSDVRIEYIEMFLGRIDPFSDDNFDSTHDVRIMSFSKPTRNRVNQYSIQIGAVK